MFTYNCRIARIVDGDTLDVDIDLGFGIWKTNERIRLWQIDTPECRTRDKEEKKYVDILAQSLLKTVHQSMTCCLKLI